MNKLVLMASCLLLSGCLGAPPASQVSEPIALEPSPPAGSFSLEPDVTSEATMPPPSAWTLPPAAWQLLGASQSDSGLKVLGGTLEVKVSQDGQPVPQANLRLYGETLASGVARDGQGVMNALEEGSDYRLVISAPGRQTLAVEGVAILSGRVTTLSVELAAGTEISGRVLWRGQPVAGAAVSDGLNTALSDAQGHYVLTGLPVGGGPLRASKPHFHTLEQSFSSGTASLDFELVPSPWTFSLDSGGIPSGQFQGLRESVRAKAPWRFSLTPPVEEGVRIVASTQDISPSAIAETIAFVRDGGKLVLMGEWGGFGGFSTPGANRLAHRLGVHFNPDLLRESSDAKQLEWLRIRDLEPSYAQSSTVRELALYGACSLFALPPMAPLAWAGKRAYHIQAMENQPVVATAGCYGSGKVIAFGDCSAWTDEDTDHNGKLNYQESDNLQWMLDMLNW